MINRMSEVTTTVSKMNYILKLVVVVTKYGGLGDKFVCVLYLPSQPPKGKFFVPNCYLNSCISADLNVGPSLQSQSVLCVENLNKLLYEM